MVAMVSNKNGHAQGPESKVDVLIIGAGPAGVMAADMLARYNSKGVSVRIIDKRSGNLDNGQADGLNSRSLEIFESLGFIEFIEKESSRMSEINFWNPDERGRLTRTGRIPDTIPGLSRFQQSILHQARVEYHLREDAKKWSNGAIEVERGVLPESLEVDESLINDPSAHPVKVVLRHLSDEEANPTAHTSHGNVRSGLFRSGLVSAEEEEKLYKSNEDPAKVETVYAKYVIGCDGAHSWTRRTLGFKMLGDQTTYVWGVVDCAPKTNFPDERDLVRLYIQLPVTVRPGEYLDKRKITPERIMDSARAILHPYTLESDYIEWFTGYHIGQRLTESFGKYDRVFLAGDACHTHSPKAGQGMNTSMQDTFNLGWKLGHVLTGLAKPALLDTYSSERQLVAQTLIDFDTKFSRLFSGKPQTTEDLEGVDLKEFKDVFATGNEFASGMSIEYRDSMIVGRGGKVQSKQELATKLQVGKRFFGEQVVNVASATADFLTTRMPTDGAFRVLVFAGNVAQKPAMDRLRKLASYLDSPESVVSKYTPRTMSRWDVIDVITIHSSPRFDVPLYDFPQPSIFPGLDGPRYKKIYVDDESYHRGHGHAYERYGISKERGAIVVVRPDQYVSLIVDLEDTASLDAYFSQFMVPAADPHPASLDQTDEAPNWDKVSDKAVSKSWAVEEAAEELANTA